MTQCYTDTEYASFTRQTIEHACDPLIQRNLHDGQYLVDNPLDSTLDLCRTEPLKDVIHHVWPQVIAARCDAHDDGTSLPTIPMEFLYGTIACQRFRVIEDEDSDQHAIVFFRPAIKHYAHSKRLRFCSPDSDA
jgi:hypothetical protein